MTRRAQSADRWRLCIMGLSLIGILTACGATARAEEVSARPATRHQGDAVANQLAHDVFSGEEFWWKRTSDVKSTSSIGQFFSFLYQNLIRPVFKAISDFFSWLFRKIFGGLEAPLGDWSQGIPFLWTIIVLLVLFVAWRLVVSFRQPSITHPKQVDQARIDLLPHADQLLDQARACLAQGDHRAAIRFAFLSLLAWLQDRGQLKYDPSRSNREYHRDLRGWPESAASFRAAADPFERCWYGGRALKADQVQDVISLCRKQFQGAKGNE